jgi:hypothetical protein
MDRVKPQTGQCSPGWAEWVTVALVLLGAALLHAGGLRRPFFADDYLFLEQVRGRSLPSAILSPDPLGNFVRPVSRQVYFWVVSHVGGESPALFHLVNLGLFLASLLVFYAIVRRTLGRLAAVIALAFVAFQYAADVPLSWASGSQDLLAVLFATLAVYFQATGRRPLAAIALLLGLLSKEVVATAAIVAIVGSHGPNMRWRETIRRGLGLLAVTAAWGVWWVFSLGQRPMAAHGMSLNAGSLVAAIAHLVQVALGLELRLGGQPLGHWSWLALLPAVFAGIAVWLARRGDEDPIRVGEPAAKRFDQSSLRLGVAWTLGATLPLVLVMPIWSAYFYLWALFGVGILLATFATLLRPVWRVGLIVVLVLLAGNARRLDEFAASGGAWSWQSHVNGHYLDRALHTIEAYLCEMRAERPSLPPRSTVFFANVPVSSGWQSADGPLVRWAYRDSTLRSYFFGQFTKARAERGPVYFFAVEHDRLRDKTGDPTLLRSFAFSMLLGDRPRAAVDVLDIAAQQRPGDKELRYWRAWPRWALGDTLGAIQDLADCGMSNIRTLPAGAEAGVRASGADTAARIASLVRLRQQSALNGWVHARLAAVLLARGQTDEGAIEAYSYRVLARDEPDAWRKLAAAQLAYREYEPALGSLTRYLELTGQHGQLDREAQLTAVSLRRLLQGDIAQNALR